MNLMITINQKSIIDTQKKRKESKHNTKDNHQITREENKRKKQKRTTKTINKRQEVHTYQPINNYFKYKWAKCPNQKTLSG